MDLGSPLACGATALALALGAVYLYFRWCYTFWARLGVPYIAPSFPCGNLRERVLMRQSPLDLFHEMYWKLDGHRFGGVYQLLRPALLIRDPELIKHVLVKDFATFQDRGIFVDEAVNPLSAHLFNLGGARWRQLRAKLTPTFTAGKMRAMFGLMRGCARELVALVRAEAAGGGGRVELKEALAKFTTDVIGSCAFGLRCNAMRDPASQFRAMGRRVFRPSRAAALRTLATVAAPALAALLRLQVPERAVSDFFLGAVKETMEFRRKNGVRRNDFLQLLMQLKSDSEAEGAGAGALELTDSLLAAQAFVFFLAGFETSSSAISFSLLELALNPEIQEKLRSEINAVVEENNGVFSYEALMKMEYLDMVICETLRKYPPLSALVRESGAPFSLPGSGVRLPAGTRLLVPVHALHTDPRFFPQPQRFDPARFSEAQRAARPRHVYLPFGAGPRLCVGMRFGQLQTKLGLAMLLHSYSVSTCDKTCLPVTFDPTSFLTVSVGGMWLNVTPIPSQNEKTDEIHFDPSQQ